MEPLRACALSDSTVRFPGPIVGNNIIAHMIHSNDHAEHYSVAYKPNVAYRVKRNFDTDTDVARAFLIYFWCALRLNVIHITTWSWIKF